MCHYNPLIDNKLTQGQGNESLIKVVKLPKVVSPHPRPETKQNAPKGGCQPMKPKVSWRNLARPHSTVLRKGPQQGTT